MVTVHRAGDSLSIACAHPVRMRFNWIGPLPRERAASTKGKPGHRRNDDRAYRGHGSLELAQWGRASLAPDAHLNSGPSLNDKPLTSAEWHRMIADGASAVLKDRA